VGTNGLVAVDMGGSFLKSAVVVPAEEDHATLGRTFARIPMSDTAERTVSDVLGDALQVALQAAERLEITVSGIGVCSPGPFDWARGVSRMTHKFLSIRGVDLRAQVQARVPRASAMPMHFVPDSYAFAAGERLYGVARGYAKCLYITLGTGVGSALSEGDRVFLRLPGKSPDGAIWDAPFRDGTTEDYVSKRAMLEGYGRLAGGRDGGSGGGAAELDVNVIGERARSGEKAALEVFHQYGRDLGAVLYRYASEFRPQCIVIGGGLAPCFGIFEAEVREELKAMPDLVTVAPSPLGDHGPLLGAAATYAEGYHDG
jgi:glucokinase